MLINENLNNSNLPVSTPFSPRIMAIPGLKNWYRADASEVVLDGAVQNAITSFTDKVGSSDAFTQPTSTRKAILTPNKFGVYAGAVFDGALTIYSYGGTFNRTTDFSIAMIFYADPAASGTNTLWSSFNSASQRTLLNFNANQLAFAHGSKQVLVPGLTYGTPHIAIVSVTNSGGTLSVRLDGGTTQVVTGGDNNAGTAAVGIGSLYAATPNQLFKGGFSDLLHFTGDIIGSGDYALIEGYARGAYKF